LLIVLWALVQPAQGQEMWGAAHSNFAGQMGIDLNPASIADATYKWELHLLSADVALVNNYMYLARNSRLIRKGARGESVEKDKFTDRYTPRPDKSGYGSAFLKIPGFIWSGKRFAVGVHASNRTELSVRNMPYHLAKYLKQGFDYDPQQDNLYEVDNMRAGFLNWHQFGITGAAVVYNAPEAFITAGITVNNLYALDGLFIRLNQARYIVPADTLLVVENMNAEYGYALPRTNDPEPSEYFDKRGGGTSVTLGVQYFRNRNDAYFDPCKRGRDDKPYTYRAGLSLIDFGYINFTKDARTFLFNDRNTLWYGIDTTSFNGILYTDSVLSTQFYGGSRASRDGIGFRMWLPSAVSTQFDYAISGRYFVNLTLIQRVPIGPYGLRRSNQIAITPRFETRKLEVSMPVSVYDFFRPRIGFAVRYGAFTLGSDMISPFLGLTDSYGANLFFGISIRNFTMCDGNGGRRRGASSLEKCNQP
jgi:hypothetical protein